MSVQCELQGDVAVIRFDDGKANAFTGEVLDGFHAALDQAGASDARAVVLAGRPGRFSAGFNLAEMTVSHESMATLVTAGARLVARILLEPRPVVAACTGHALAAGALVLLAADHRIGAAGDWKIGLNEVAIGMPLPRWAVELARYRISPTAFEWRVMLGQIGGPEEALTAGFLDRLVAAEAVVDEAVATATALSGLRTGAVEGTKHRARSELVQRMLAGIEEDLAGVSTPDPA